MGNPLSRCFVWFGTLSSCLGFFGLGDGPLGVALAALWT